jgi:hypothetical protein
MKIAFSEEKHSVSRIFLANRDLKLIFEIERF